MTHWFRTPVIGGPVRVRGGVKVEETPDGVVVHRLPAAARAQLPDDFIRMCEAQPSGVRLVLRTASRRLELDVRATRTRALGRPVPDGGLYDVVVDGEVIAQARAEEYGVLELDPAAGTTVLDAVAPVTTVRFADLPAGDKDLEIWLPYGEVTRLV